MLVNHILPTLALLHYAYAVLRCRRQTGYLVDFFLFFVGATWIFPYFVISQLASDEGNILATGEAFYDLLPFIDQAFILTFVGYASFWAAKFVMDISYGKEIPPKSTHSEWPGVLSLYTFISLPTIFFLTSLVCAIPAFFVIGIAAKAENIFAIRALVFDRPEIRPIFNLFSTITPAILFISAIRFSLYRRKSDLMVMFFFCFSSFLTGTRGSLLSGLLDLGFIYICYGHTRIGYGRISVMAFSLVLAALLFSFARAGSFAEAILNGGMIMAELAFGNSFSDVRDFAWVLSGWNGDLFAGKTYLAALMSFVPSFISEFRSTYNLGRVTASIAGHDPQVHPGLRPTMFGEAYLNFGAAGVVVAGFLFGIFLWALSRKIMFHANRRDWLKVSCYIMLAPVGEAFMLTPSFFSVYVIAAMFILIPVSLRAISLHAAGRN